MRKTSKAKTQLGDLKSPLPRIHYYHNFHRNCFSSRKKKISLYLLKKKFYLEIITICYLPRNLNLFSLTPAIWIFSPLSPKHFVYGEVPIQLHGPRHIYIYIYRIAFTMGEFLFSWKQTVNWMILSGHCLMNSNCHCSWIVICPLAFLENCSLHSNWYCGMNRVLSVLSGICWVSSSTFIISSLWSIIW